MGFIACGCTNVTLGNLSFGVLAPTLSTMLVYHMLVVLQVSAVMQLGVGLPCATLLFFTLQTFSGCCVPN